MVTFGENGKLSPLLKDDERYTRRQDLPAVYSYNGAVYVGKCDRLIQEGSFFTEPAGYIMPFERSIDIDTISDLDLAASLLDKGYYKFEDVQDENKDPSACTED